MKKKKVIVTTDDYGVIPSVNDAIIDAVNECKVNSIAALPNYDGMTKKRKKKYKTSVENAKMLLDETNGKGEIGCHLTLTSGRPITKAKSMIDEDGYFRGIYEFKRTIKPKELREELNAQVKVFTEANIPITHLSCHHNVLTFFPELYQEYLKVAKDNKLAIRSGNSHPKKSMNKFLVFLRMKLMDDMKKSDRKEIKIFSKKAPKEFFLTNIKGKLKTTSFHDSGHYGPIPGAPIRNSKRNIKRWVNKKNLTLKKSLEKLVKSDDLDSMEFILHIAKNKLSSPNKYKDIDYPGVDSKYFDSRYLEYKSIMKFDFSKHPDIELASWKNLKK
jgi:predicted glycoside hydrolase/deacetylase ChbG (UPF0249 family)